MTFVEGKLGSPGHYMASYPYNKLLPQLEEQKVPAMKMMIPLERRLQKEGLLESFNKTVADFQRRGVISWVSNMDILSNLQRSYIPLTYVRKSDPEVTTRLHICGNSSFKSG